MGQLAAHARSRQGKTRLLTGLCKEYSSTNARQWGMVNLAGSWHSGWWKFSSCDANQQPRELYAREMEIAAQLLREQDVRGTEAAGES